MLLAGKVIFVSGAGPGLGYQLIKLALSEGAKVCFSTRTPQLSAVLDERLATEMQGSNWRGYVADVTDSEACARVSRDVAADFGDVDILICNAFRPVAASGLEGASLEDWRLSMDVNLFGNLNMVRALVPQLIARHGALIVINSMNTRRVAPGRAGNAVSKAALLIATQYLADELGPKGVRVNSVLPGWMWGPSVEQYCRQKWDLAQSNSEELRRRLEKELQISSVPTDEDCARAIIALASDYFSAAHGACLDINGGSHLALT